MLGANPTACACSDPDCRLNGCRQRRVPDVDPSYTQSPFVFTGGLLATGTITGRLQPRFFLAQDDDSHWYLVPEQNRAEWEAWTNISKDDPASWNVPDFAKSIDGPHTLTFADPQ